MTNDASDREDAAPPEAGAITSPRDIPPVRAVVDELVASGHGNGLPRPAVTLVVRSVLEDCRAAIRAGAAATSRAAIVDIAAAQLARRSSPLASVINATGVLLHTGLGRAPMPAVAVRALAEAAGAYVPIELDLASGERGRRIDHVREVLCALTGAESATVVNNCAAALLIILRALAAERSVVVSRGELVEIGGSFRLPDIMAAGGSILREVGTTNRTRLADYEAAIDDWTALLLKVHASNYRIEGFAEEVGIGELAELGRRCGLSVVHDIGSGALVPVNALTADGLPSDEPSAAASIAAGADLVLFSGDKLLGGPQAGLIVGRADLIGRVERHPMMRAMRVDKVRMAALAATLTLHMDPERAAAEIPALAMSAMSVQVLRSRAERIASMLEASDATVGVEPSSAYLGGGSLPANALPSIAIVVRPRSISETELAARLRAGRPAVLSRVSHGAVRLDIRSVFPEQDEVLARALRGALT